MLSLFCKKKHSPVLFFVTFTLLYTRRDRCGRPLDLGWMIVIYYIYHITKESRSPATFFLEIMVCHIDTNRRNMKKKSTLTLIYVHDLTSLIDAEWHRTLSWQVFRYNEKTKGLRVLITTSVVGMSLSLSIIFVIVLL